MNSIPNVSSSSVVKYYENRSIFITGATGFLGKVLLEKLLRSCNGIGNIYLLIRPSKAKSPEERLQQLFESAIFDPLRKENKDLFHKVISIPGDITSPNLGISPENRQLLSENVSVVFHSAATVRFNEPLAVALQMNLEGAKYVLELSKTMKHLSSHVHVSTAYCNTRSERNKEPVEEIVYPAPLNPKTSFNFLSKLEDRKILDSITPLLLDDKPNTYVFSKHLAEGLVELEAVECKLPVCIVRPAAVCNIHRDPVQLEGWMDNINGAGAILNGVMTGLNYVSQGDLNIEVDFIPVDYVVKIMILAAWETAIDAKKQTGKCRVYNACIGGFNPISLRKINEYSAKAAGETPWSGLVRPPSAKVFRSSWWLILNYIFVLPQCVALDFISFLRGQKPKMRKFFKRVSESLEVITHFKMIQYDFNKNDNVKALRSRVPASEKKIFDLNMEELDWPTYFSKSILGMRRYVFKEDDSTIPAAVRKLRWLRCLYNTLWIGVLGATSYLLWKASSIYIN